MKKRKSNRPKKVVPRMAQAKTKPKKVPGLISEPITKKADRDGLHRRRRVWYFSLNVNGERKFFSTKTSDYQLARTIRAEKEKQLKENKLPNELAAWPFSALLAHVLKRRLPPHVS